jgi:diadenosine tetraphosphate (Ap4A) HIT family hydrolase
VTDPECPICQKHRGEGPLVGPVIWEDDLVFVAHRATGSLGYAFVETQRHAPHLDDLTDAEAEAVGRVTARLALGLCAELDVDFVHSAVLGMGVAHFHQHVFVRHANTPDTYAWWQAWPDAPQGDTDALAKRLHSYIAPA